MGTKHVAGLLLGCANADFIDSTFVGKALAKMYKMNTVRQVTELALKLLPRLNDVCENLALQIVGAKTFSS